MVRRSNPATATFRYVDVPQRELICVSERQLARKQAEDDVLIARWTARRAALRERDAKLRWFCIGFGLAFGLTVVALLVAVAQQ